MSAATEIRGALAAKLTCWHRLTGHEAGQLVHLHLAQNAELDARQARIDVLQKDADRLDWLADTNNLVGNVQLPTSCVEQNLHSLRAAIDAAMAQSKQGGA